MGSVCCLVGAAPEDVPRLAAALQAAVGDVHLNVALFDVIMLHALAPEIIVIDVDAMKIDPSEALRQMRFALPRCLLIVFARQLDAAQVASFRFAGANALIAKASPAGEIEAGLREALKGRAFVDGRFTGSA